MRSRRWILRAAGLTALLALVLSSQTALAAATPEAALTAYFAAAAKGDVAAMKKLSTGAALKDTPKPGTKDFGLMKLIAGAFKNVSDVKVTGNQARAVVNFDEDKLFKVMMDLGKREVIKELAKIKDPAQRAKAIKMMEPQMRQMARKMSKVQATLLKTGGNWLVAGLK